MKDILTIVFWIFLVTGSLLGFVAVYLFFHYRVKDIAREMKLFSKEKENTNLLSIFKNSSDEKAEKKIIQNKNHRQSQIQNQKKKETFAEHLEDVKNEKDVIENKEEFLETQYMGSAEVSDDLETTFIRDDQNDSGHDEDIDMESMSTTYIQEDMENQDTTYINEEDVENMATTYVGGSEKKRNGFEEFIIEQEEAIHYKKEDK